MKFIDKLNEAVSKAASTKERLDSLEKLLLKEKGFESIDKHKDFISFFNSKGMGFGARVVDGKFLVHAEGYKSDIDCGTFITEKEVVSFAKKATNDWLQKMDPHGDRW